MPQQTPVCRKRSLGHALPVQLQRASRKWCIAAGRLCLTAEWDPTLCWVLHQDKRDSAVYISTCCDMSTCCNRRVFQCMLPSHHASSLISLLTGTNLLLYPPQHLLEAICSGAAIAEPVAAALANECAPGLLCCKYLCAGRFAAGTLWGLEKQDSRFKDMQCPCPLVHRDTARAAVWPVCIQIEVLVICSATPRQTAHLMACTTAQIALHADAYVPATPS